MSYEHDRKIYIALWKKVLREDQDELRLDFETPSQAISFRLGMYKTMAPFRAGKIIDPKMIDAGEAYAISVPAKKSYAVIRKKSTSIALLSAVANLQFDEADFEREVDDNLPSIERIKAAVESDAVKPGDSTPSRAPNPFFHR